MKGGKQMSKPLSPWSKRVKTALIEKDMSIGELATMIGKSRVYVSAIVNGRIYAEPTIKEISDVLNIEEADFRL